MNLEERIQSFDALGGIINKMIGDPDEKLLLRVINENPWFTREYVLYALKGIRYMLDRKRLRDWVSHYDLSSSRPKKVGVVMAGNIPMAGFHDLLSVLISGHKLVAKLSSQDNYLMKLVVNQLISIHPEFRELISVEERLTEIDCIIATGSDNSARYFEYYFSKYPNIIRKNRTSVAVLTGNESREELSELGKDIFTYFGLGCRNVSTLLVPGGYDFAALFESVQSYESVIRHHKYANNYDYNKSILLLDQALFLDNGFLLVKPDKQLVSPISVLHYRAYESVQDIPVILQDFREKVQCVVGKEYIPFGKAQMPEADDYADGVDTLKALAHWGRN